MMLRTQLHGAVYASRDRIITQAWPDAKNHTLRRFGGESGSFGHRPTPQKSTQLTQCQPLHR